MKDLITMTTDSKAFLKEVEASFPDKVQYDESEPPVAIGVSLTKTPTVRGTAGTLALCRVDAQELADLKTLKSLTILAEVAAGGDLLKAMSKANRKKYDAIHDQTPQTITMEDGTTSTYTPPALIGAFA